MQQSEGCKPRNPSLKGPSGPLGRDISFVDQLSCQTDAKTIRASRFNQEAPDVIASLQPKFCSAPSEQNTLLLSTGDDDVMLVKSSFEKVWSMYQRPQMEAWHPSSDSSLRARFPWPMQWQDVALLALERSPKSIKRPPVKTPLYSYKRHPVFLYPPCIEG